MCLEQSWRSRVQAMVTKRLKPVMVDVSRITSWAARTTLFIGPAATRATADDEQPNAERRGRIPRFRNTAASSLTSKRPDQTRKINNGKTYDVAIYFDSSLCAAARAAR